MKFNPIHIKRLIEELAEEKEESLDYKGFISIGDALQEENKIEVPGKYLYETYGAALRAEKAGEDVNLRLSRLDELANVLGFHSFLAFTKKSGNEIAPDLQKCAGNWWSMVRANTGNFILKAPVRIYSDEKGNMKIDMQGGQQVFKGIVRLRAGNIFCELDSERDKIFYIVLKVGVNEKVNLLQGVFAGMSSAADPIGGRELFLRAEEKSFEEMKWQKLPLEDESLPEEVRFYFKHYERNCIKVNKVSRFTLDDLML